MGKFDASAVIFLALAISRCSGVGFDVLDYIDPLIGTVNGGTAICVGRPNSPLERELLMCSRPCLSRGIVAVWHGQSSCRRRYGAAGRLCLGRRKQYVAPRRP